MEIDYKILENEIIEALGKNPIWVLSTSLNDYVTSRPMSIINEGLTAYFQTNKCYVKHEQMSVNHHAALCCQNISIEGTAEGIGNWEEESNSHLLELYKSRHIGSYNNYGSLSGQLVYKVSPVKIKLWKYANGEPFREILYVKEQRAERLNFQ